jgi:RimJ/RimL family protein N-acetyltransferase
MIMPAVLETERLLLRLPRPTDLDAFCRAFCDPEVARYLGPGGTPTREQVAASIERYLRAWELDGFGHFAVERLADRQVIGRVGLLAWNSRTWTHGDLAEVGEPVELEVGWVIARADWGHGYATEAAAAVRDWTFRELQPPRVISLIHPDNVRSQRVAEKLGERYERDVVTASGSTPQLWTISAPVSN